jgi:hypothetical protein
MTSHYPYNLNNVMKALPVFLSALLTAALSMTAAFAAPPSTEWLSFMPAGSNWDFKHPERKIVRDFYSKVSFVPKGQSFEGWQQMFTMQTLERQSLQDSREEFMNKLNAQIKKQYKKNIASTVIRKTPATLLYETRIRDRKSTTAERQELIMIIDGVYTRWVLSYTNKGPELPEETRNLWIKSFDFAKVVPQR